MGTITTKLRGSFKRGRKGDSQKGKSDTRNGRQDDVPRFVKITGGEFRGRKIATPGGVTHPMGERERIALFNMLGDRINRDVRILDAYAGGGTLGLEAISRGARKVSFCERDPLACKVIDKNATSLGISCDYEIFQMNADELAKKSVNKYDIVLMDPPYDKFHPEMIDELSEVLTLGGLLVVSHPGEPAEIDGLIMLKTRKYAGAHITIYEREISNCGCDIIIEKNTL